MTCPERRSAPLLVEQTPADLASGRALDLVGSLELLNGPGGLSAGPFPAAVGSTVAIGASGQVTIPLDEAVPDGPWDATLTLRSGLVERGATALIRFPASGSALPVDATPVGGGWPMAAIVLVLGLLASVVGLLALQWRRPKSPVTGSGG